MAEPSTKTEAAKEWTTYAVIRESDLHGEWVSLAMCDQSQDFEKAEDMATSQTETYERPHLILEVKVLSRVSLR